jgi:MFS family permease
VRRGTRLASLRPLGQRDFALIWASALVSNIGSWMQTVAVGVLITDITGRAGWTGLVAAAAFLPIGLLSPVGGAIADRIDRRRLLLMTAVAEAIFAATLAGVVATGNATAASITLLVLAGGCMTALGLPAFQAILPDLVSREDLLAASSLGLAQFNLGRVIGPALAGLVLAVGSFTWAFVINAVSYGAVVLALLAVRLPEPTPSDEEGGLWRRIVAGARGAWAEPGCRLAILTIAVIALLLSPFIALVPAVADKLFDSGETGTSVLITAQGVGAVVGGLLLASAAKRFGRPRLLIANLIVLPLLLIGYAVAPNLAVATVAFAAVGMGYVGLLSGLGTTVQLRAPAVLRARILSLYMVALGVVYPLGAVIHGVLGDRLGLRWVTGGTAALFLFLVLVLRTARPHLSDALDDPLESDDTPGTVAPPATAPPPSALPAT